jgi:excisionase family DNA binding protein
MSYTIADLAHRWQLSEETIRKMIVRGDIPAFRIGKQWRVTEETVKWIETKRQQPPAK